VGGVCFFFVCLFVFFFTENIARNKTYSQSSTHTGFSNPPSHAANGNTSGDYSPGNCIHTQPGNPEGWWEVDLGHNYTINELKVWGRNESM
jgi:hypothetical protein